MRHPKTLSGPQGFTLTRAAIPKDDRPTQVEWFDKSRTYRVLWNCEAFGVGITPGYRVFVWEPDESAGCWRFAGPRIFTSSARIAVMNCENHAIDHGVFK